MIKSGVSRFQPLVPFRPVRDVSRDVLAWIWCTLLRRTAEAATGTPELSKWVHILTCKGFHRLPLPPSTNWIVCLFLTSRNFEVGGQGGSGREDVVFVCLSMDRQPLFLYPMMI